MKLSLDIQPLTPDRWADFQTLFGKNGACAGCWCQWWRLTRKVWTAQKGEGNRRAMRACVKAGPPPGLLAYANGQPVGWCAIAPREVFTRLANSRLLQPVDDQPVWAVTCFFVARDFRRRGVSVALLQAAAAFVRERGGKILEGYPVEPKRAQPDAFVYTGLASAFREAGFTEILRRSATRPILRRVLKTIRKSRKADRKPIQT